VIPRAYITAWRKVAPWQTNEQVEQDLVISRALIAIFSDDFLKQALAFRGGTALHKLYLQPAVRYSEDIDLVQTEAGPIGAVLDRLRQVLSFLGTPRVKQKASNNTMVFSFDSEIPPTVPMKLKIEVNCREHFAVFGLKSVPFQVVSRWFSGQCGLTTFALEELLGSKLRALYQRRKGRDLFDLWYALKHSTVDTSKVVQAFGTYMQNVGCFVTRKQFQLNLKAKIKNSDFKGDISGLIRPGVKFDIEEGFNLITGQLFNKI